MTIVVDSNIVAALALPLPYDAIATEAMHYWTAQGERLIAPTLMEYELVTIVRRGMASNQLRKERVLPVLNRLQKSGVETIAPTMWLHEQALYWAERIGQGKAYDAHYLALAAREDAALWTADKRLVNAAQAAGLTWVHWIGDWRPGGSQ
jgi:predicted nucleic acid-binding protein